MKIRIFSTRLDEDMNYHPISPQYHLGKLTADVVICEKQHELVEMLEPSQQVYQLKLGIVDAIIQYTEDITYHVDRSTTKYMYRVSHYLSTHTCKQDGDSFRVLHT